MSVTISDIAKVLRGYCRNQSLSDDRAITAINSADTYISQDINIPNKEKEYRFSFFDDQMVYSAPSDYLEPMSLRFDDDSLNKTGLFSYRRDITMFRRQDLVDKGTRLFGEYKASGLNQIMVLSLNSIPSYPIDTFDYNNSTNWTASNDATDIEDDLYNKKEGSGSMSFDIVPGLSVANKATLKRVVPSLDLSPQLNIAHFRAYWDCKNITNLTSVSLSFGTDVSNYWTISASVQQDGSAFIVGWNNLDWYWNDAVSIGNPNPANITFWQFDINYTGSYTGGNNYHFDYLNMVVPDTLVLNYTTNNVGKNSGGTNITRFSATTDVPCWSGYDDGLIEMYGVQAAVIVNPQLLVSDKSVKELYASLKRGFSMRYPKKRWANLLFNPSETLNKRTR